MRAPFVLGFLLLGSVPLGAVAQSASFVQRGDDEEVWVPPFVASNAQAKGDQSTSWSVAKLPGIEVFSRGSKSRTEKSIAAFRRQARLVAWELPPGLSLARQPVRVVLDDRPFSRIVVKSQLPPNVSSNRVRLRDRAVKIEWDVAVGYASLRGGLYDDDGYASSCVGAIVAHAMEQATDLPIWVKVAYGHLLSRRSIVGDEVEIGLSAASQVEAEAPLPDPAVAFHELFWRPVRGTDERSSSIEMGRSFLRWALYADAGPIGKVFGLSSVQVRRIRCKSMSFYYDTLPGHPRI